LLELEQRFGTQEACRHHLTQLRWPNGFICPFWQEKVGWPDRRHRWTCQHCRRQSTVTAGPLFQGTHLLLPLWFRAVWLVSSQKHGGRALVVMAAETEGLGIGRIHLPFQPTAFKIARKTLRQTIAAGGPNRPGNR
jgi:hypothetical protein